ncbi:hypothetical protein SAMN04488564_10214 [Lentzea waywayandensis]|uniref:WXG100 family type VII secretion target n=1 Tax=Lentzea waywayandensis TaxID=84724 RepID=A0A1I6D927_9PSEU|nr:hypothetical protein [Lentzea waywayandensis]SFR01908.1 hypothetical protein SAMN04488564_10214 [Lentzea waywayandensis]
MISTDAAISLRDGMSSSGGSMSALDATIRPIDALSSAGLGWLISYVQPLQDVVDRMAGLSSVIQTFTDGWQRAAAAVEQVQQSLERAVSTGVADWKGEAGDAYRARADEITTALRGVVALATATGTSARGMGEIAANARQSAGDLLADLVQRLISYVSQAKAVEGGVTSNVMAQATTLVNSYQAPISEVEQELRQAFATALGKLTGEAQVASLGSTGVGTAVLSTWKELKKQLDSDVHQAQVIIQIPPPPLPLDARPATKAELDRIAQNPIFAGKLGYKVTIGEYAEAAALQAMGLTKNEDKFHPYLDSRFPEDRRKHVIPDAVGNNQSLIISSSGTEYHVLPNGYMVDIKATSSPIGGGDEQFKKYVDYLSKNYEAVARNDPDVPRPSLIYVGTSETQIGQRALDYATRNGVEVWRSQIFLSGPESDPRVSVGPPMALTDTDHDMPILGSRPPQQAVPLFNSPYDELLRRKLLEEEQN